jgi:hypothetical protein
MCIFSLRMFLKLYMTLINFFTRFLHREAVDPSGNEERSSSKSRRSQNEDDEWSSGYAEPSWSENSEYSSESELYISL